MDGDQTDEDTEKEPNNPVPVCRSSQALTAKDGKLLEKKTVPPGRYTQATLIKKLESEGIGRPATYAAIMDNIVSRGYVKTAKKFLVPTETGDLIVDSLVGKFKFADLEFTRRVEEDLDQIAAGNAGYESVVAGVHTQLLKELAQPSMAPSTPKPAAVASSTQHPCPACQKPLRLINGKNGKFWGCSGYPTCTNTLPDDAGKPGKKQPLKR